MLKDLIAISSDDLKKSDKRGLATLYLYWLENGKKDTFDLPLFIDDNGKGVLSVECFKRVFYAFCVKCGIPFSCDIINGNDGDNGSYNIVRIDSREYKIGGATLKTEEFTSSFTEPKKTDTKRESSKKTTEKSNAKKEEAKKEADSLNEKFAKERTKKILDVVQGYGLKCTPAKLALLEAEIIKILKS